VNTACIRPAKYLYCFYRQSCACWCSWLMAGFSCEGRRKFGV